MQTRLDFTFKNLANPQYKEADFLSFQIIMMNPSNQLSICCKSDEFFLRLTPKEDGTYSFSHTYHSFDISHHIPRNYDLYVQLQLYKTEDNFRDRTLLAQAMRLIDQASGSQSLVYYINRVTVEFEIQFRQKPVESSFRFIKVSDLHIKVADKQILQGIELFDTYCVEIASRDYSIMEQVESIVHSDSTLHIVLRRPLIIDYGDCDIVIVVKAVNFGDKPYVAMMNFLQLRLANISQLPDNEQAGVSIHLHLFNVGEKFLRFDRVTKFVNKHLDSLDIYRKNAAVASLSYLLSPERYLFYSQKMGMKNFISFYDDYQMIINGDYGLETLEFSFLERIFEELCLEKGDIFNLDRNASVFFNVTKTSELTFGQLKGTVLQQIQENYQCYNAVVINPIAQTDEQLHFIELEFANHSKPLQTIDFPAFQSMYIVDATIFKDQLIRQFLQDKVSVEPNPNENFFLMLYQNPVIISPNVPLGNIKIRLIDPLKDTPLADKMIEAPDVERLTRDGDDFVFKFIAREQQVDLNFKAGQFKYKFERPFEIPGLTVERAKQRPKITVASETEDDYLLYKSKLACNQSATNLALDEQVFPKMLKRNYSQHKPTPDAMPKAPKSLAVGKNRQLASSSDDDLELDSIIQQKIRDKLLNPQVPKNTSHVRSGGSPVQNANSGSYKCDAAERDQFSVVKTADTNTKQNPANECDSYLPGKSPINGPGNRRFRRLSDKIPSFCSVSAKIDSKPPPTLGRRQPSKIFNKYQQIEARSKIADYFHGRTNVVPGRDFVAERLYEQQGNVLKAMGINRKAAEVYDIEYLQSLLQK